MRIGLQIKYQCTEFFYLSIWMQQDVQIWKENLFFSNSIFLDASFYKELKFRGATQKLQELDCIKKLSFRFYVSLQIILFPIGFADFTGFWKSFWVLHFFLDFLGWNKIVSFLTKRGNKFTKLNRFGGRDYRVQIGSFFYSKRLTVTLKSAI